MKYAKLKYKPSNNVFEMPYDEALRFFEEDEDNYEILGEKKPKKTVKEDTGIFNQVVIDKE